VLHPVSNLQNTDCLYQSSFSTIQVSGVGCQEDTEAFAQKTDDSKKKAEGFLPSVIGFLTPDTIDIALFKELN
jgi:hypothetical protein